MLLSFLVHHLIVLLGPIGACCSRRAGVGETSGEPRTETRGHDRAIHPSFGSSSVRAGQWAVGSSVCSLCTGDMYAAHAYRQARAACRGVAGGATAAGCRWACSLRSCRRAERRCMWSTRSGPARASSAWPSPRSVALPFSPTAQRDHGRARRRRGGDGGFAGSRVGRCIDCGGVGQSTLTDRRVCSAGRTSNAIRDPCAGTQRIPPSPTSAT